MHLSGLSVGSDVRQLLLGFGVRLGLLVGLDGSFVGMYVGWFTLSVGEDVGS